MAHNHELRVTCSEMYLAFGFRRWKQHISATISSRRHRTLRRGTSSTIPRPGDGISRYHNQHRRNMPWEYSPDLDAFTIYHKVIEGAAADENDGSSSLLDALGHAIAGAAATAFSNSTIYPLDLVITRLQVQQKAGTKCEAPANANEDDSQYDGVRDAAQKIYRNEGGLPAFYSGLGSDTFKSIIDSFLFFLAYNILQSIRPPGVQSKTRSTLEHIGIGMLAGAFTKGITSPIQQVVTRKQTAAMASGASSSDKKPHQLGRKLSAMEIANELYSTRGIRGFWSGYSATLILTLNPSLTFFTDSFLRKLGKLGDSPSAAMTFLVAAFSKATASSIMYPVSLAKTRAQAAASSNDGKKDRPGLKRRGSRLPTGIFSNISTIAKEDGIASLYAGLPGEVFKGFFSHGLTMLVKERIHRIVIKLYFALVEVDALSENHSKTFDDRSKLKRLLDSAKSNFVDSDRQEIVPPSQSDTASSVESDQRR